MLYRERMHRGSAVAIGLAGLLMTCGVVAASPASSATQNAQTLLTSLPVSPEHIGGYDRSLFKHWIRQNGCTTRQIVLIREAIGGRLNDCTMVNARWYSAYDGLTTTNARTFDIDHEVPLKEAWDSGAWRWTPDRRTAFANDLGYVNSLIAVSASSNRSKSDQDPADWLPTNTADTCRYVKAWIGVKYRWRLAVDSVEKSSILQLLRGCPQKMEVPDLASA